MSEMTTVCINLTDRDALVLALKEMKFSVESSDIAKTIKGYYAGKGAKAHVILRKFSNKLYADAGFEKIDNQFSLHLDSLDKKKINLNRLKQLYSKYKLEKTLKKKGIKYRLKSETLTRDGNIKIKIALRNSI